MATFDLNKLYGSLASYKGLHFPIGIGQLPAYKLKQLNNRIGILKGEKNVKNIYGQPVIMPVVIAGVILGSGDTNASHLTIQPMVVFEGKKNIVKNKIAGGSYAGTVKEFINMDDYIITITGVVVNRNQQQYPSDQVSILKRLYKVNSALSFDCAITNDLFTSIVITSLKFKALEKSPGMQFYEIKALSDSLSEVEQLREE